MQLNTAANRYRLKLYKFIQPAKGKIIRPGPVLPPGPDTRDQSIYRDRS
jgi:hypothetical protein